MADETDALINQTVGNTRFTVGKFVAGGSFGRFHHGIDGKTLEKVAIKLEKMSATNQQLFLEFGFYRRLGSIRFIPRIFHFGPCQEWHALVMELLGPSLLEINQRCGGTFGIVTTTQLTLQLLNIFEYVHEHGLIYRDTKPENFLLGQPCTDKWFVVHLIDLGFCKTYLDEQNRHIEYREGKCMTGTVRYISVNNHHGRELSRRDDMEALLYMVVFLHKGEVPWQGVQANSIREKYHKIGQIKERTSASELCSAMPVEYAEYLEHIKSLQFEERPAYRRMMRLFRNAMIRMGVHEEDRQYDWDEAQQPKSGNNVNVNNNTNTNTTNNNNNLSFATVN